jgi:hypothetical protein
MIKIKWRFNLIIIESPPRKQILWQKLITIFCFGAFLDSNIHVE